jgi:hypothetical protein
MEIECPLPCSQEPCVTFRNKRTLLYGSEIWDFPTKDANTASKIKSVFNGCIAWIGWRMILLGGTYCICCSRQNESPKWKWKEHLDWMRDERPFWVVDHEEVAMLAAIVVQM